MKWAKLEDCPSSVHTTPIILNSTEFIVLGNGHRDSTSHNGMYKFNLYEKKWMQSISYPKGITRGYNVAAYDQDTNHVYILVTIFNPKPCKFLSKINIKTGKTRILHHNIETGLEASGICINNQLHIIGGDLNNKHYVYIPKQQKFDILHEFDEYRQGFSSHKLIHLKSKNILLLMGGYDDASGMGKALDTVYKYDIPKQKWMKLEISVPSRLYRYGYAVSMNEEYICLFGGCTPSSTNSIYVLNIKQMIFYKSNINCPKCLYEVCGITVIDREKNEYLVIGYLKQICKLFAIELPMDIMKEMELWYGEEYVHIIAEKGDHWRIKLHDILDNVSIAPEIESSD